MSLLSVVDEAIRLCYAEEVRVNENIYQCRQILESLRTKKKHVKETESTSVPDNVTDPNVPPEERQEMELLEKVLEKAVRIRSGSAPTKNPHTCTEPSKVLGAAAKSKDGVKASGGIKGNPPGIKPTSKHTVTDRKEHRKCSVQSYSKGGRGRTGLHPDRGRGSVARGLAQKRSVGSAKGLPGQSSVKTKQTVPAFVPVQPHAPTAHSDYEESQSSVYVEDASKATATSQPPYKDPLCVFHIEGTRTSHPPQNGMATHMLSKWRSLRNKQSRLWDKVMDLHLKPIPERSCFMERMRTTFPREWPSGSPSDIHAQVDTLTRQAQDLTHCYQTRLLLAKQTSRTDTQQPAPCREREYESWLMLDGLEKMVADLLKQAGSLRDEWEAWDRWWPAEGSLCPVRKRGGRAEATVLTMPPAVTYASQAEFIELERLRLGVELLEQEIDMQQALSDTLSLCLSSLASGPGGPHPALLRDTYALLGEGGEHFPALVLDGEPD